MNAERVEHCRLDGKRLRGARLIGSVSDVDVIGAVPRHEGIARDAIEGGADKERAYRTQLLESRGTEVQNIREKPYGSCIALQHAFVEDDRDSEVFAP